MDEIPRLEDIQAVTGWLSRALEECCRDNQPRAADLSTLSTHQRTLLDQLLGEGEVTLTCRQEGQRLRFRETTLPGVWRAHRLDAGGDLHLDRIEVCDAPPIVRRPPEPAWAARLKPAGAVEGVINALPLLTELAEHLERWKPGKTVHTINLTLLPMSPADLNLLHQTLGSGPVEGRIHGYGDTRVNATACPGIWWVRHTNAVGKPILDTLEITDLPAVICAAPEDLEESRRRFMELMEEIAA